MRIVVIGGGFVGLPHAAICAEYGHEVCVVDTDHRRIEAYQSGRRDELESIVNEPGLYDSLLGSRGHRLFFTHELAEALPGAELVFICVPTPPQRDGATDLTLYDAAVHQLGIELARRPSAERVVIANKSTVPIGTARRLERILREHQVHNFGVASNPEFLPQGNAMESSRRPDRVVVGADTPEDFDILRRAYSQFVKHVRIRYFETSPETAEATKYVANTLLLSYISFWNGVGARLAETFPNLNMEDLRQGVCADSRISTWGSFVSNGAGGSCFGKDIQSLMHQLGSRGRPSALLKAVYDINEHQKSYLIDRAIHEAGFDFNQKTVALLGLAFKKHTNDMRDSSALKVAEFLLGKGVRAIRAYDPLVQAEAGKRWFNPERNHLFEKISYHDSVSEALEGTQALFISTDWEEFRGLSTTIRQTVEPPYLIMDGRRMLPKSDALVSEGFSVVAVGSTTAISTVTPAQAWVR